MCLVIFKLSRQHTTIISCVFLAVAYQEHMESDIWHFWILFWLFLFCYTVCAIIGATVMLWHCWESINRLAFQLSGMWNSAINQSSGYLKTAYSTACLQYSIMLDSLYKIVKKGYVLWIVSVLISRFAYSVIWASEHNSLEYMPYICTWICLIALRLPCSWQSVWIYM